MGENGAGKIYTYEVSLVCIGQILEKIILDGKKLNLKCKRCTRKWNIYLIHQELHPVPHRSVGGKCMVR